MDYFQGVVTEYLRADRSVFVNTELLIQLEPGDSPAKGRHWYCDAVAVNFRESVAYLCEISYSVSMHSLLSRMKAWGTHWAPMCAAVARDCRIPKDWEIEPWLFIPRANHGALARKLALIGKQGDGTCPMPVPRVTYLEKVTPWNYRSWDRKDDAIEQLESSG